VRTDAPFLVKRYAPMMGRPESRRRVVVDYQAYSLEEALHHCRHLIWNKGARWVERRGQPAWVRR